MLTACKLFSKWPRVLNGDLKHLPMIYSDINSICKCNVNNSFWNNCNPEQYNIQSKSSAVGTNCFSSARWRERSTTHASSVYIEHWTNIVFLQYRQFKRLTKLIYLFNQFFSNRTDLT